MKRKGGLVTETIIFGVLMAISAVFIIILAADAPEELQNIFTLLKRFTYVGGTIIPGIGVYFFWQMWKNN